MEEIPHIGKEQCAKLRIEDKSGPEIPARPQWFVINAYAQKSLWAEKVLSGKGGLPHFIPKRYVIRNIQYRPRKVLVPLIPNMIFVHSTYARINSLQQNYSFMGFATCLKDGHRTPLVVPDGQMESFRKVAEHYEKELLYYKPEEVRLKRGEYIRIVGGEFDGVVGRLIRQRGRKSRRVVVEIPNLAAVATTDIEPEYIQIVTKDEYLSGIGESEHYL